MERCFIKRVPYYTEKYRNCGGYVKLKKMTHEQFVSRLEKMPHRYINLPSSPEGNIIYPNKGQLLIFDHFFSIIMLDVQSIKKVIGYFCADSCEDIPGL